ncbi:hypothetical protein VAS14_00266 [Vibrio angustum S14]|uniref:Uncharacterized protein n=1 Tax=Photobacterium angustum (strain S14 / CCUG 15956) TaxID=314292 RepID=Q1ZJR6_PHOAS|nr:hypothetical protein [Photobacterium angustum]EAS62456.1 hypothetical protein VAS14_00266 [Vibrio angustum S14] [Photobacterium angustum S14]
MIELTILSLALVCFGVPFLISYGFYNLKDKAMELRSLRKQIKENARDINDSVADTNRKLTKVHKRK